MDWLARCFTTCSKPNQKRQEKQCCDATIIAEGKEFPVQRNVLCDSSPYFTAMFKGHFLEKSAETVEIIGVSSEILPVILDYMYGVNIELTLSKVTDIYRAADMFCLDSLVADCKLFVKKKGEIWGSIEQAYEVATLLELCDISEDIIEQSRQSLYTDDCQKDLKELSYYFMFKVLNGTRYVVRMQNKSCILNNVLQWAFLNPDERFPDSVIKLFSLVHFEYVSPHDFTDCLDILSKKKTTCSIENFSQIKERLESAYRLSHQKAISQQFYLVLPHFSKTVSIYVFNCETWKWDSYGCDLDCPPELSVLSDDQLYLFYGNGSGRKFDLMRKMQISLPVFYGMVGVVDIFVADRTQSVTGCFYHITRTDPVVTLITQLEPSCTFWETVGMWEGPRYFKSVTHGQNVFLVGEDVSNDCSLALFEYNTSTRNIKKIFTFQNLPMEPILVIFKDILYVFSRRPRENTKLYFVAFDLKLEKMVTSDVNSLDLDFPVLSAHPVASGILIAQSCANTIVLALYRPTGHYAIEHLGVISLPEKVVQNENLSLFFYVPK